MTNHIRRLSTIPISLYLHIPWCIKKCPYCDFNSYAIHEGLSEDDYITRLIEDLQQQSHSLQGRSIQSIFIGGGTPSLFSALSFERLLTEIKPYLSSHPQVEITLEANPGSSEQERFAAYRKIGINRISLGIQSLNNHHLKKLGRVHNNTLAKEAYTMAREAGFDNINVDLMFGLPEQTTAQALQDLATAIIWQPQHISWYQLTIEPNTYFYKYPPALPDDDISWEMQQEGQLLLHEANYQHYEVSAYSKPGYSCQHNVNYWRFGDYLGIGAGAHSKITDIITGQITRSVCWRNPRDYLSRQHSPIAESKIIPTEQLPVEFMLNALRLQQAIPTSLLQRAGISIHQLQTQLDKAQELGLLNVTSEHFIVTQHGKRFLNDLVELFL